ncbi:MAG: 4'-phosphopantetheinyl transferase superfamily protein [Elusimicrobiota bacterium]
MKKPYRYELCSPQEADKLMRRVEKNGAENVLSYAESDIVRSFKSEKRRRDWLAGRLAAKRLLRTGFLMKGNRLSLPEIEILNHPDGAPYIRLPGVKEYREQPLSITHAGNGPIGGAATAEKDTLIGIDIETNEPRDRSFLELMAHPSERDQKFHDDSAEQTRIWTLKESVSKLLGTGFSVGFWEIRFPVNGTRRLELHGGAYESWERLGKPVIRFDSFARDAHIMSIAYTAGDSHA